MPDKPQPGKDKDLRYIRHAIDDADKVSGLLNALLEDECVPGTVELVSEAMLLMIEQYDELNQMLDDVSILPPRVIELNRLQRDLLRLLLQERLSAKARLIVAELIQILGGQFKSLMVVKDIRGSKAVVTNA